jgi:nitrogen fixation NifU-like protein
MYSDKVMDHFSNPRNVGEIADADGVGEEGNPVCGDMMTFYVKVDGDRLTDVKFKTFGCGAAIAVSSMVSEMAIGKTIAEAMRISNKDVAKELGGLPPKKLHCSNLGADALHKAIQNYFERRGLAAPDPNAGKSRDEVLEERFARLPTDLQGCPKCKDIFAGKNPTCQACGTEYDYCPACEEAVRKGETTCAKCGAAIGSAASGQN